MNRLVAAVGGAWVGVAGMTLLPTLVWVPVALVATGAAYVINKA